MLRPKIMNLLDNREDISQDADLFSDYLRRPQSTGTETKPNKWYPIKPRSSAKWTV